MYIFVTGKLAGTCISITDVVCYCYKTTYGYLCQCYKIGHVLQEGMQYLCEVLWMWCYCHKTTCMYLCQTVLQLRCIFQEGMQIPVSGSDTDVYVTVTGRHLGICVLQVVLYMWTI